MMRITVNVMFKNIFRTCVQSGVCTIRLCDLSWYMLYSNDKLYIIVFLMLYSYDKLYIIVFLMLYSDDKLYIIVFLMLYSDDKLYIIVCFPCYIHMINDILLQMFLMLSSQDKLLLCTCCYVSVGSSGWMLLNVCSIYRILFSIRWVLHIYEYPCYQCGKLQYIESPSIRCMLHI